MKLFSTTEATNSTDSDTAGSRGFTTTSEAENAVVSVKTIARARTLLRQARSKMKACFHFLGAQPEKNHSPVYKNESGFTLIEMLTAVAVITMILSITLTQQSNFSETVNLNNVTHEVALAVRQAQSYGVTSLDDDIVGEDDDNSAYGVIFDTNSPQTFTMYRNDNGNIGYQPSDTEIEVYQLPGDMEIVRVCINDTEGDTSCPSGDDEYDEVAITFSRPNPDAAFRRPNNGNLYSSAWAAVIVLEDDSGSEESVVVRSIGFISVQ